MLTSQTGDAVRSTAISACLRLLILLLSSGALRAQDVGNIAGQVRFEDGSFPDKPITITVESHGAIVDSAYLDNEGRFGFYRLLSNHYYVVIEADGYQAVREPVVVDPKIAQTNIVHLVLRASPKKTAGSSPAGPAGANRDLVDVADFAKKFPSVITKEFEAGKKADQKGDAGAAMEHYQRAVRLAPGFYPAHNNLGTLYMKKGDMAAAESEFRQVVSQNHNGAQAYFNLGNILYVTRRDGQAKQTLEEGLRREPGSAMGHYLHGSVLVRLGDFVAAEEELKATCQLDPKMPQAPIALATLYLQTGRDREAAAMFEFFLQQFPGDPLAPKVRASLSKMNQQPLF